MGRMEVCSDSDAVQIGIDAGQLYMGRIHSDIINTVHLHSN